MPRRYVEVIAGAERKPFREGSGRLELARAITSPDNPLTARVLVNRVWMHHFGEGLVRTPSNFGALGERPTHPELLDWLAARFIESGWSMKAMHREIMLSNAYQEAYDHSEADAAADPENRLVWRANFRRLEVESIRDSLLFATGTLDERLGGPPQELGRQVHRNCVILVRRYADATPAPVRRGGDRVRQG